MIVYVRKHEPIYMECEELIHSVCVRYLRNSHAPLFMMRIMLFFTKSDKRQYLMFKKNNDVCQNVVR